MRPPTPGDAPAPITLGLRAAASCSMLTALTTFLLWWLPLHVPPTSDFAATIALHENPWHLALLWVNLAHNWLALFGYIGAAAILWRRAPGLAVGGLTAFAIWAVTELVGISVNLFAVNRTWRAAYVTADDAGRASLRTLLAGWDAVWDAMFFLLLVAFLLGSLFYGVAAVRRPGLERVVGLLLLAAVPLTALIMIGGYTSAAWANSIADPVYPVLQPVSRLIMGAWLWREARSQAGS